MSNSREVCTVGKRWGVRNTESVGNRRRVRKGSVCNVYTGKRQEVFKRAGGSGRRCLCVSGLGIPSFQKNAMFLRSFPFFIKEHGVLCVLFRSL